MAVHEVPHFVDALDARAVVLGAHALDEERKELGRGVDHRDLAHQLADALLHRLHLVPALHGWGPQVRSQHGVANLGLGDGMYAKVQRHCSERRLSRCRRNDFLTLHDHTPLLCQKNEQRTHLFHQTGDEQACLVVREVIVLTLERVEKGFQKLHRLHSKKTWLNF